MRMVLLAASLALAAGYAHGDVMRVTSGTTGRVVVERDVSVDGVRVDIDSPGNKVNGGQLHVVGAGRITVGAGGIADETKEGRYCVFRCPIAFAADLYSFRFGD